MRVLVTGASGFIGSALGRELRARGHEFVALGRGGDSPRWSVDEAWIEDGALEGVDAVVHLAGESIGQRWTTSVKRELLQSRTAGTSLIARAVAEAGTRVLISGSAIGYYGDRGSQVLTEDSGPGKGFLAGLCQAWESAAQPAIDAGVRTVFIRTGLVLDDEDGSFPRMLLPFKLGVGGRIGSGEQYWAWITLHDHVRAIVHCLETESVSGAVNLTSPNPVPNAEFARALASTLHRPALFPVPRWALGIVLGPEFADEVLLASQRVVPTRLEASGFEFDYPELEAGLREALD